MNEANMKMATLDDGGDDVYAMNGNCNNPMLSMSYNYNYIDTALYNFFLCNVLPIFMHVAFHGYLDV